MKKSVQSLYCVPSHSQCDFQNFNVFTVHTKQV